MTSVIYSALVGLRSFPGKLFPEKTFPRKMFPGEGTFPEWTFPGEKFPAKSLFWKVVSQKKVHYDFGLFLP